MTKILFCAFATLLTSCAQLAISRHESLPPEREGVVFERQSFLWGFAPGPRLQPIPTICSQGNFDGAQLEMTGRDVFLTSITLGLYVPHRVTIYCGK